MPREKFAEFLRFREKVSAVPGLDPGMIRPSRPDGEKSGCGLKAAHDAVGYVPPREPGKVASKKRRMSSVWRSVAVFAKIRFAWVCAVDSVILSRAAVARRPLPPMISPRTPVSAAVRPFLAAKPLDLGTKIDRRIDDEESGSGAVKIKDRSGSVGGERDDMGDQRRAAFAARQLKSSAGVVFGLVRPRCCTRKGIEPLGKRRRRGREPPIFIAQLSPAPQKLLGLGIGEDHAGIFAQQKCGKARGRNRRPKRFLCRPLAGKKLMDLRRPLQMRREGFQEVPFLGLDPNRIRRLWTIKFPEELGPRRRQMPMTSAHPCGQRNSLKKAE